MRPREVVEGGLDREKEVVDYCQGWREDEKKSGLVLTLRSKGVVVEGKGENMVVVAIADREKRTRRRCCGRESLLVVVHGRKREELARVRGCWRHVLGLVGLDGRMSQAIVGIRRRCED